ncbi:uncharacterized protein UBRO_20505 [Ustilago bromivora]|uniref:Reverse transcriptase Ty1/copia-type domain-containing protein n=1 Tax=Ustilago bromivora TaxID=307758 RepID=A0A1K0FYJ5_9BASI|nr:uncharacterized protein UBRO_20505 [Ustilago bromivora]
MGDRGQQTNQGVSQNQDHLGSESKQMSLDLTVYIQAMVSKWLKRTNQKSWIPMLSITMIAESSTCDLKQAKQYQELVGQLLWVSNMVQPDISFATGVLAWYMSTSTVRAWSVAIHVLKYLNQTNQYWLQLGENTIMNTNQLVVTYINTNWVSDPMNRCRSTSGAVMHVYGCLVSWKSHVQKCIALSAVEAEFVAVSEASREALFFSHSLRDLGILDVKPVLCTNSQGCIQVSKDLAKHWKLKHINTRYYFVRDHVQDGDIVIEYVRTTQNMVDILMKPLEGLDTLRLAHLIGLGTLLRGGVKDTLELPEVYLTCKSARGTDRPRDVHA